MKNKTVHFATQKRGGKRIVLEEVREFDPTTSRIDGKVGDLPASSQLNENKKKGKELRSWINKSEKHLKTLKRNMRGSETMQEYENHLTEFIQVLEYQLEKVEEHRSLCQKRNRVSVYTDKNICVPYPLI